MRKLHLAVQDYCHDGLCWVLAGIPTRQDMEGTPSAAGKSKPGGTRCTLGRKTLDEISSLIWDYTMEIRAWTTWIKEAVRAWNQVKDGNPQPEPCPHLMDPWPATFGQMQRLIRESKGHRKKVEDKRDQAFDEYWRRRFPCCRLG